MDEGRLLAAQRLHRVHSQCLPCGHITGDHRESGKNYGYANAGHGIQLAKLCEIPPQYPGQRQCAHQTQSDPSRDQHYSPLHHQRQDFPRLRPQCCADADLTPPLAYCIRQNGIYPD